MVEYQDAEFIVLGQLKKRNWRGEFKERDFRFINSYLGWKPERVDSTLAYLHKAKLIQISFNGGLQEEFDSNLSSEYKYMITKDGMNAYNIAKSYHDNEMEDKRIANLEPYVEPILKLILSNTLYDEDSAGVPFWELSAVKENLKKNGDLKEIYEDILQKLCEEKLLDWNEGHMAVTDDDGKEHDKTMDCYSITDVGINRIKDFFETNSYVVIVNCSNCEHILLPVRILHNRLFTDWAKIQTCKNCKCKNTYVKKTD